MTKADRHASRRETRHARAQRRRGVRFAVLGVLTLTVIAAAVVVFVMLGSSSSDKAGATTWSAPSYTGGPRLAVDRTLIDVGSVPYGHEVDASYRLKNVGDRALTLQQPTVDAVQGC